jgi:hypothetical protein
MNSFSLEQELFEPVVQHFEKHGCIVASEVRIGFCRADIVAFHPDGLVSAIELKLADWKKAIVQAKNYQLAAGHVYVAFPSRKSILVLKRAGKELLDTGIGLISIEEQTLTIETVISAQRSSKKLGTISINEVWMQRTRC